MDEAHYMLTFPAYGTWLPGPARGSLIVVQGDPIAPPEPDRTETERRRAALKWPAVELNDDQRQVVGQDLRRLAAFRGFTLHEVIVAPDHVHVGFSCPGGADVLRLVQYLKGAPARALSVAAGDPEARSVGRAPLPHHKWWGRQYVLHRLTDADAIDRAGALCRIRCASVA